nr:unnamed protein product [Callosobruchus analis]
MLSAPHKVYLHVLLFRIYRLHPCHIYLQHVPYIDI